ncbi:MAG: hypothetical protein CMM76_13520 [Rhodospirillaceae bacterium]|nr:hypothetical protein [Rhodospirillaceae bacterium]|tara:strand:+ start:698 stop:1108 length:411 start_codon:yes stop_codon:yes gene_type:complete
MLKNFVVFFCFILAGCAAKRNASQMMPVPAEGTREALLLEFTPSGSPCLDGIVVNLLHVGCSAVGTVQRPEYMSMALGCYDSQPGATDMFSRATFIYSGNPMIGDPLFESAMPYCGDQTGVYAVLDANIRELGGNE